MHRGCTRDADDASATPSGRKSGSTSSRSADASAMRHDLPTPSTSTPLGGLNRKGQKRAENARKPPQGRRDLTGSCAEFLECPTMASRVMVTPSLPPRVTHLSHHPKQLVRRSTLRSSWHMPPRGWSRPRGRPHPIDLRQQILLALNASHTRSNTACLRSYVHERL